MKSLAQVEGLLTDDATAVEIDNKLLKTAASVSTELVMAVIERLRREGLTYIVSPYESDGQLAFLLRMGIADAVNTADSDLIVLGCKEVITGVEGKEWTSQWCNSYRIADILSPKIPAGATADSPVFNSIDWSLAIEIVRLGAVALLLYALVAGSDYVKLDGISRKRGIKIVRGCVDGTNEALFTSIERETKTTLSPDERRKLETARIIFTDQLVFDPNLKQICALSGVSTYLYITANTPSPRYVIKIVDFCCGVITTAEQEDAGVAGETNGVPNTSSIEAEELQGGGKKDDGRNGCKGQNSQCGCIHVSAGLQILENLLRPLWTNLEICTAKQCTWNRPSANADLDDDEKDSKTADNLRISKAARMMAKKGANRLMLHPDMSRVLFNPLHDDDAEQLKSRDDSVRATKRQALYDKSRDKNGNKCAAEEQWDNK